MSLAGGYVDGYGDGLDGNNGPYGLGDSSMSISAPSVANSASFSVQTLPSAGSSHVPTGSPIDWNGLFQRMLESPGDTQEQRLKKYEDISTLNNNFVSMAKQLGKIIITEAFLPDEVKTIKPYSLGGVAGGRKYLYNGILFKLQTDWKGIYKGDHNAMKSGSLELKGLMRYYGFHKIHVPLMAIIDFRGYRLLAESKLPIGPETLHYGSADAGITVKDGSACLELKELMKTVGTALNLAGHWCGLTEASRGYLHGPIDVEGHQGHDGRFYVIDLARVFPPTAESDVQSTFLHQAFRPEFVRRHKTPLSSDAFSRFSRGCPDAAEHNDRVRSATVYLLEAVVPEFADWLEANPHAIRDDHPLADITELAHREGINVRYLGLVRSHLRNPVLRNYALMELIARVIKNKLNEDLRKAATTGQSKNRGAENYFPIALKFFNLILGNKAASDDWWKRTLKDHIKASYKVECLSYEEQQTGFSLRPLVNFYMLFRRLQQLTGVRLTKIVMQQLKSSASFELVSPDIRKMGVRVKHMNITSQAQGSALAIQAMGSMTSRIELNQTIMNLRGTSLVYGQNGEETGDRISSYDRLFNLSTLKYEQAIRATPDNKSMLTHYASVLIRFALLKTSLNESSATYFANAFQKLRICGNTSALLQLGELLQYLKGYWNETDALLKIACDCFQAVTEMDPTLHLPWTCWADTLVSRARVTRNASLYALAGEKYRQSIKLTPLLGGEFLSNCHHCLSDPELAAAVDLLGRTKTRRCDSMFPILESTPTGEPIHSNDKENEEYRKMVYSISYTTGGVDLHSSTPDDSSGSNPELSTSASISAIRLSDSAIHPASPVTSHAIAEPALHGATVATLPGTQSPTSNSTLPPATVIGTSSVSSTLKTLDASLAFKRSMITPGLLDPIISNFPTLKALKLARCNPLPTTIPQHCPTLTELNVSGCETATDRWIATIVVIPTLMKLDISHCSKLSHVALKDVMVKCCALTHFYASYFGACREPKLEPQVGFSSPNLQILHVAGFRTGAESWCRLIACSTWSSIRKLVLDECMEVNDAVLASIGQHCPLTHISLRGCTNVTNQGIEALLTGHTRIKLTGGHKSSLTLSPDPPVRLSRTLKYMDLTDCHAITAHTLDVLGAHLSHLESLLINNVYLFGSNTSWLGVPISDSNSSIGSGSGSISGSGTFSSTTAPNSPASTTHASTDSFLPLSFSSELRASADRVRLSPFQKLIESNIHLCRVEMAHTGLCDTQLAHLASSAKSITQLKLVSNAITDAGLHLLSKSNLSLQLLDLEGAAITDVGLTEMAKAFGQTLSALSLSSCVQPKLTDEGLVQVSYHCPKLMHLDLSYSSVASDRSITAIAERCPRLQRLSLVSCRFLTDNAIEALGRHAHKLHFLNLSRCPCIISLGPLGEGCPELRELHVRGCEFVSDDTPDFDKLANLRALRLLDVQGCHYITDITLGMLETDACPDLEILVLGRNKIRDSHVQSLRQARRNLTVQNISDQPLSSSNALPRSTSLNNSGSVLTESTELAVPGHRAGSSHAGAPSPPSHLRGAHSLTTTTTGFATKTLMNDLKSIQKNPVPYVSAEPVDESNLYVWHGNLLGPENTPYAGAIFHIELVFPADYPTNPPSATLFTPLPHPHVHKDHICLDILSDYKGYFSAVQELEGKDTKDLSGWHPSYTVQSILLSMQSFLMDMKENAHGAELRELMVKIPDSIRIAANFECPKCAHRPGQAWPPIAADVPMVSMSEKQIISEELRCVHTRAPFTEEILGICVEVTGRRSNGAIMNLGYHMQLLSHKAFQEGVRTGSTSHPEKMVFMPLFIDDVHGRRAMPVAEASIAQLSSGYPGTTFQPTMALDVLTQLMKAMVVDLIKINVNINALQYYFASHRLLIAFGKKYPEILAAADRIATKFAESPHHRSKRECPDLGCFLMLLTISQNVAWRDVAQAYMQESFVRNAPRAMEKAPELATPVPNEAVDNLRNEKTFLVTRVSLGIAMLQCYFLEHIGRPKGVNLDQVAATYDALYGRLPVKVREDFLEAIKGILNIKTWAETFKFLGLPPRPNEEITTWLRDCVQLSIRAGYYHPNHKRNASHSQSHDRDRSDHHDGGGRNLRNSHAKGGSSGSASASTGSISRSGSAKFNNTRDAAPLQPPQSHSTSTTPKRNRSRASSVSSNSASSETHEYDVAEFDGVGPSHLGTDSASSSSLPNTRATSPNLMGDASGTGASPTPQSSNHRPLAGFGATHPHHAQLHHQSSKTSAWGPGTNPVIDKARRDTYPSKDEQQSSGAISAPSLITTPRGLTTSRDKDPHAAHHHQATPPHANIQTRGDSIPAPTILMPHSVSSPTVTGAPLASPTSPGDQSDEDWIPANRPRRKSGRSRELPTMHAPGTLSGSQSHNSPHHHHHGSPGRGLGRGQSPHNKSHHQHHKGQ
jgi:ubiquitin-protein ligase